MEIKSKPLLWPLAATLVFMMSCTVSPEAYISQLIETELKPYTDQTIEEQVFKYPERPLEEGFNYYNKGEYNLAIEAFVRMINMVGEDRNVVFYLANSFLGAGDLENALVFFNKTSIKSDYYQPAVWLKILVNLELGQRQNAVKVLKGYLALNPTYKVAEAKQLLSRLEELTIGDQSI